MSPMVKWGFRGMAFAFLPLTWSLPNGVFVFWTTTNAISLLQTLVLRRKVLPDARIFMNFFKMYF